MTAARSDRQVLRFRAGDTSYAVDAASVREVARVPRLTRVPHAPEALAGLGKFRGEALPVLSLAKLDQAPMGREARIIVLDAPDPFGLLIDQVDGLSAEYGGELIDAETLLAAQLDWQQASHPSARAALQPSAEPAVREDRVPLLLFRAGDQNFAVPLDHVAEICRLPSTLALMPGSDRTVAGTMERGGELVALFHLSALLGLTPGTTAIRPRILLVEIGGYRVGLIVERVEGVVHVPTAAIDPIPVALARSGAETRIQAICRLDGGRRLASILSVDHILRQDVTERLHQGMEEPRMGTLSKEEDQEQFLLFRVGGEDFALALAAVDQVARLPGTFTTLPRAPDYVLGLMNLRGEAVPIVDQGMRFAGPPAQGGRRRIIFVHVEEMLIGFLVDEISGIVSVPASALGVAPTLGGEDTKVFERVAHIAHEDRLILVLSPRALMDGAERDLLAALAGAGPGKAS